MNLWLQNCETESKGPRKVTKDVIRGLVVEKKDNKSKYKRK